MICFSHKLCRTKPTLAQSTRANTLSPPHFQTLLKPEQHFESWPHPFFLVPNKSILTFNIKTFCLYVCCVQAGGNNTSLMWTCSPFRLLFSTHLLLLINTTVEEDTETKGFSPSLSQELAPDLLLYQQPAVLCNIVSIISLSRVPLVQEEVKVRSS